MANDGSCGVRSSAELIQRLCRSIVPLKAQELCSWHCLQALVGKTLVFFSRVVSSKYTDAHSTLVTVRISHCTVTEVLRSEFRAHSGFFYNVSAVGDGRKLAAATEAAHKRCAYLLLCSSAGICNVIVSIVMYTVLDVITNTYLMRPMINHLTGGPPALPSHTLVHMCTALS